MTAPGPVEPAPGRAAFACRPGAAAWALPLVGLLVALLALLPCGGSAMAASPSGTAASRDADAGSPDTTAGSHDAAAAAQDPAAATADALATPGSHPAHTATTSPKRTADLPPAAQPRSDVPYGKAWCSRDVPLPGSGHGCSGDSWFDQQSQLPNAPPQPGAAVLPRLLPPRPTPVVVPVIAVAWPAPTPDLHLLQVNRP